MEGFTRGKGIKHPKTSDSFYQLVLNTAKNIASNQNIDPIGIENKIVLSMAIRLLAEQYMHDTMIRAGKSESDFVATKKQTNEWTKKLKKFCPNDPNIPVIEEVNIMTPELIHINSFMFEPLIDMSILHLKKLYENVVRILGLTTP